MINLYDVKDIAQKVTSVVYKESKIYGIKNITNDFRIHKKLSLKIQDIFVNIAELPKIIIGIPKEWKTTLHEDDNGEKVALVCSGKIRGKFKQYSVPGAVYNVENNIIYISPHKIIDAVLSNNDNELFETIQHELIHWKQVKNREMNIMECEADLPHIIKTRKIPENYKNYRKYIEEFWHTD